MLRMSQLLWFLANPIVAHDMGKTVISGQQKEGHKSAQNRQKW